MSNPKSKTYQVFQLLEPVTETPEDVARFAREFIGKSRWIFAKTMPEYPHEYVLRRDSRAAGLEDEFLTFARMIRQHGYAGRFHKTKLIYMNVDDWRYWTMGRPITNFPEGPPLPGEREPWGENETTLINRARNDDLPVPCCSLSIATGGKHHAKNCHNYQQK